MENLATYCPTSKDIIGVIEVLRALNRYPMYNTKLHDQFTEITHLALTSQISAILFKMAEKEGSVIHSHYLPRIVLYQAFFRYVTCSIPDATFNYLFTDSPRLKIAFTKYLHETMVALTSPDFVKYISDLENTVEMYLYKVSESIATYIEANQIKPLVNNLDYQSIFESAWQKLSNHKDFSIVGSYMAACPRDVYEKNLMHLFNNIFSNLRNIVRWKNRALFRIYTVLGHSFDVGVLNYLIILNQDPKKYSLAEQGFYIGLYHDVAEYWTGDIPTPLKDGIPGLRKKTEKLEVMVLKKYVFSLLPPWFIKTFKTWMLEMVPCEQKNFFKTGDELAAIIEAATQIASGSGDMYFSEVVDKYTKNPSLPVLNAIFKKLRKDAKIE